MTRPISELLTLLTENEVKIRQCRLDLLGLNLEIRRTLETIEEVKK